MLLKTATIRYVRERRDRQELAKTTAISNSTVLLGFAASVGDLPLDRVNQRHIRKWLGRDVARSTARTQFSVVRGFFDWAVLNKHVRSNPCQSVKPPRLPRTVPRGLRSEAVGKLFTVLDPRGELISSLMVQEGLRCVEVSRLRAGDVDHRERAMLVVGKGGHERVLPLSEETWLALNRYLSAHPVIGSEPLVRSYSTGRGISANYISAMMAGWMKEAGIKERPRDGVSGHALRHTAATDMLRAGADLRDVQTALGHASIGSTQVYLAWEIRGLRDAMSGRTYRTTP